MQSVESLHNPVSTFIFQRVLYPLTVLSSFLALWITAIALLVEALKTVTRRTSDPTWLRSETWNGAVNPTASAPLIISIILPNLPQLLVSFAYLLYNDAITRMLLARETSRFAARRKPLRVSNPEGEQKSTYWLQLPYRYSIPLLVSVATIHWTLSRSIFFQSMTFYGMTGEIDNRSFTGCEFSSLYLIVTIALTGALIQVFLFLSFGRLESGMPLLGSCSMAISAACANCEEGAEAAKKPLMYGVLTTGTEEEQGAMKRVGFSQHEVMPLEKGVKYL